MVTVKTNKDGPILTGALLLRARKWKGPPRQPQRASRHFNFKLIFPRLQILMLFLPATHTETERRPGIEHRHPEEAAAD